MLPLALAGAAVLAAATSVPPTEPAAPTGSAFEQALGQLPVDALQADGAVLQYVDMALAWDRIGAGADVDARTDAVGALSALPTWTQPAQLFGAYAMQLDEARAEVGFTFLDIEREIAVLAPPRNVFVAETSVDPETVAAAVHSDPLWSDVLTEVDHPHGGYFQWGDDPLATDLERRTPMRPLGQGGQLALVGSDSAATVVRTLDAADMEAVLDTLAGAESLLADPFIAAALPAIGDGDVYQVSAIPEPTLLDPALVMLSPESAEQILAATVLLQPYVGTVIVEVDDGSGPVAKVLLINGTAADAEANAALAEQALAENVDLNTAEPLTDMLPGAEVSTEGTVVVVTLPFEGAYAQAQRMLVSRALFPS
jgi:hypothetical protein